MFRKCYEPHLRDYPDCFQECGLDECEAPLYSEKVVVSEKCGNCGTSRMVQDNYMVEKCPNCGDDEYEIGNEEKLKAFHECETCGEQWTGNRDVIPCPKCGSNNTIVFTYEPKIEP